MCDIFRWNRNKKKREVKGLELSSIWHVAPRQG